MQWSIYIYIYIYIYIFSFLFFFIDANTDFRPHSEEFCWRKQKSRRSYWGWFRYITFLVNFMIGVVTCFILWSNSLSAYFFKKSMFYVRPRPQDPVRGKPGGWGGARFRLSAFDLFPCLKWGLTSARGFLRAVHGYSTHTEGTETHRRGESDPYSPGATFLWYRKHILVWTAVCVSWAWQRSSALTGLRVADRSINKEQ